MSLAKPMPLFFVCTSEALMDSLKRAFDLLNVDCTGLVLNLKALHLGCIFSELYLPLSPHVCGSHLIQPDCFG